MTLRRWNGDFWTWTGTCRQLAAEDELRAKLIHFLATKTIVTRGCRCQRPPMRASEVLADERGRATFLAGQRWSVARTRDNRHVGWAAPSARVGLCGGGKRSRIRPDSFKRTACHSHTSPRRSAHTGCGFQLVVAQRPGEHPATPGVHGLHHLGRHRPAENLAHGGADAGRKGNDPRRDGVPGGQGEYMRPDREPVCRPIRTGSVHRKIAGDDCGGRVLDFHRTVPSSWNACSPFLAKTR